jgi:prolyl-tRNA synthetase
VQASLLRAAREDQARRTRDDLNRYDDVIEYLRAAGGFVSAPWCGGRECERRVKEHSSATIRCLPLDAQAPHSRLCASCGRSAAATALWAQAY